MVQQSVALVNGCVIRKTLPGPLDTLMPGLSWGHADALFTPAFWATQTWIFLEERRGAKLDLHSGETFAEEVAACLLGGYSIRGELAKAAFLRLRDRGLLGVNEPDEWRFEEALREPFSIEGKQVKYRFPRTKARFLAQSIKRLQKNDLPISSGRALRDALVALPGIGMKTASWITRNWLQSDQVAILDVHVQRAGQIIGLFSIADRLPRDYLSMESRFIKFAELLAVPASVLDLVIWKQMRRIPSLVGQNLRASAFPATGRTLE
jgi:N-glycosylase/DNA lyase